LDTAEKMCFADVGLSGSLEIHVGRRQAASIPAGGLSWQGRA